jgi:anthranilate 1,2-dioxygenase small subunit
MARATAPMPGDSIDRQPPESLQAELEALNTRYCHCLDDDDLEAWPGFFTADGVYVVTTHQNQQRGFPMGVINYDSRNMMQDRVTAIRKAVVFEPHVTRHIVSGLMVTSSAGEILKTVANFLVMRTMVCDGEMIPFACGRYVDQLVRAGDRLQFKKRLVVLDSHRIDSALVMPL